MSNTARAKAHSATATSSTAVDSNNNGETGLSGLVAQMQSSPDYAEVSAKEDAAQLVFEAMQEQQMSRAELARCIGKNRSYVTKLLSGEENISVGNLEKILRALGCRLRLERDVIAELSEVWLPPATARPKLRCLPGGVNLPWSRVKMPKIELVDDQPLTGEILQ